ncbi:MAG: DUF805 domain-containing protein [Planctomycetota bacterium]|jgi:uncharacterized membrane protein YhaH (DUF805 family)|nr:DUF805 domain-containing protein [Planctomycetota bacterium]
MHHYLAALEKYAVFTGRAGRAEFWWFFAVHLAALLIFTHLAQTAAANVASSVGTLFTIYVLATALPFIGASYRRLHDTGRAGWKHWLIIVPVFGWFLLILWWSEPSQPVRNQYGDAPAPQLKN